MGRYVPKTYNNRRLLRMIFRTVVFASLTFLVLFIVLFFLLENYYETYEDGSQRLEIPWLMNDAEYPED